MLLRRGPSFLLGAGENREDAGHNYAIAYPQVLPVALPGRLCRLRFFLGSLSLLRCVHTCAELGIFPPQTPYLLPQNLDRLLGLLKDVLLLPGIAGTQRIPQQDSSSSSVGTTPGLLRHFSGYKREGAEVSRWTPARGGTTGTGTGISTSAHRRRIDSIFLQWNGPGGVRPQTGPKSGFRASKAGGHPTPAH